MHVTSRARGFLLGMLSVAALGGCREGRDSFGWRVRFGAGTSGAQTAHVETWIAAGGCAGPPLYSTFITNGGAAPNAPEALPRGRYGFAARAIDDGCQVVAQGCVEQDVPMAADATVDVRLAPTGPTRLCALDACQQGRCTGAADGGPSSTDGTGSVGEPGCPAAGACPPVTWWRTFGAGRSDAIRAVLAPGDGITIAGQLRSKVDLGGGVFVQGADYEAFVAGLDGKGEGRWGRQFNGGGIVSESLGLVDTGDGGVIVTGFVDGGGDFGSGRIASLGGRDGFVAAYGRDGTLRRALLLGGTGNDLARAAAPMPDGGLVVIGSFDKPATFGSTRLTPRGGVDVFVARLDAAWKVTSAAGFGSDGNESAVGVVVDDEGRTFVGAILSDQLVHENVQLGARFQEVPWLIALEPDGRVAWMRAFGKQGKHGAAGPASMPGSGLVFAGGFTGEADLGAGVEPAQGAAVFVALLTNTGSLVWGKRAAGAITVQPQAVVTDGAGRVIVAGAFSGPLDCGGGPLAGAIDTGVFAVAYEESGVYQWSRSFQLSSGDAFGLAQDADGVLIGGGFEGLMRFGRQSAMSMSKDMFLLRLRP